jgi:large subunit ribosomal protein L22
MAYGYSTEITDNMAKAISHSLPISTKVSTQVCRFVKGLPVAKAKRALQDVLGMKRAVPMFRHYKETAHKPGMAVGRYPVKACKAVLGVIASAEANAQFKGLNSADLIIHHAAAQQGPTARGQGRTGGQMRQTHIEIVLAQVKKAEKKHEAKK